MSIHNLHSFQESPPFPLLEALVKETSVRAFPNLLGFHSYQPSLSLPALVQHPSRPAPAWETRRHPVLLGSELLVRNLPQGHPQDLSPTLP